LKKRVVGGRARHYAREETLPETTPAAPIVGQDLKTKPGIEKSFSDSESEDENSGKN